MDLVSLDIQLLTVVGKEGHDAAGFSLLASLTKGRDDEIRDKIANF